MKIISRVINLFRRSQQARKFGIQFTRTADWQLPKQVIINNELKSLNLPDDNGTRVAFLDIFLDDCYGINQRHVSQPVETILDIGSHAGLFSLYARTVYPNALIHGYEPNKEMQFYLDHQSKIGNFKYYMEAVGSKEGKVKLSTNSDSVLTFSSPDKTGSIRQVPFKECIQQLGGNVDILKMDCEGAEWDIFNDTESWKCVKYLTMEYHLINHYSTQDLLDKVAGLGFTILKITYDQPTYGLLWAKRI